MTASWPAVLPAPHWGLRLTEVDAVRRAGPPYQHATATERWRGARVTAQWVLRDAEAETLLAFLASIGWAGPFAVPASWFGLSGDDLEVRAGGPAAVAELGGGYQRVELELEVLAL